MSITEQHATLLEQMPTEPVEADYWHVAKLSHDYTPHELKQLYLHGDNQMLRVIAPELPFIENPASEEAHEAMRPGAEEEVRQLFSLEKVTTPERVRYAAFIAGNINSTPFVESISSNVTTQELYLANSLRLASRLHYKEADEDDRDLEADIYDALTNPTRDSLVGSTSTYIGAALLSGSGIFMTEALQRYEHDLHDPQVSVTMRDELRAFVNSPDYRRLLAIAANKSIGNFLMDNVVRGNAGEPDPDVLDKKAKMLGSDTLKKQFGGDFEIAVGCPASTVRGLMNWATNILLTTYIVMAEEEVKARDKAASLELSDTEQILIISFEV